MMLRHMRYCVVLGLSLMASGAWLVGGRVAAPSVERSSPGRNQKEATHPVADQEAPPVAGAAGHLRMLEVLQRLSEHVDSLPNLGSMKTQALREELAGLGDNVSMADRQFKVRSNQIALYRYASDNVELCQPAAILPETCPYGGPYRGATCLRQAGLSPPGIIMMVWDGVDIVSRGRRPSSKLSSNF